MIPLKQLVWKLGKFSLILRQSSFRSFNVHESVFAQFKDIIFLAKPLTS
jgi:hypothetical protein